MKDLETNVGDAAQPSDGQNKKCLQPGKHLIQAAEVAPVQRSDAEDKVEPDPFAFSDIQNVAVGAGCILKKANAVRFATPERRNDKYTYMFVLKCRDLRVEVGDGLIALKYVV